MGIERRDCEDRADDGVAVDAAELQLRRRIGREERKGWRGDRRADLAVVAGDIRQS